MVPSPAGVRGRYEDGGRAGRSSLSALSNQPALGRRQRHYRMRMPGVAPESGDRLYRPEALSFSSEAASTMPSLMPNFILRGARLATMTVRRPTSVAGS